MNTEENNVTPNEVKIEEAMEKVPVEEAPVEESFIVKMYKEIFKLDSKEGIELVQPPDIAKRMLDYVGTDLELCKSKLCAYTVRKAEELAFQLVFIGTGAEYDEILEEQDAKMNFLRDVASKEENWVLGKADYEENDEVLGPDILIFTFMNFSFNHGSDMEGRVFVNKRGKIRAAIVRKSGN